MEVIDSLYWDAHDIGEAQWRQLRSGIDELGEEALEAPGLSLSEGINGWRNPNGNIW